MNPSRPGSPQNVQTLHNTINTSGMTHKQTTDYYNLILGENFLIKQNYNELLQKYNEVLCEYKKLYDLLHTTSSSSEGGADNGIINFLQSKNAELMKQLSEKAAVKPPTPFISHPHPQPHPPVPPIAKTPIPKPPIHPPSPSPSPVPKPKDVELDEKGHHHGHHAHHGHHGHHHYGHYYPYPILPPFYYPYPY